MLIPSDAEVAAYLQQQHLFPFAWQAFDVLHGNEKFKSGWAFEAICSALQDVVAGHTKRLIITVPPRYGKSICASVAMPAWILGRDPTQKIMVASYGSELAIKHAQDFRTVVSSDWYQKLFPQFKLQKGGDRSGEQITTLKGGRKAISLGGAATGFGADIIIVDDLMKAADAHSATERQRVKDFYEQTLISRLNDKATGKIILIAQRLHEDDLPGYLLESGRFKHLNLPAIAEEDQAINLTYSVHHRRKSDILWPERESRETLETLRTEMGPATFSAQYQQDPTPIGGNRMKWEWFGTYDFEPEREMFERVVQSWDTGLTSEPTSDYSACTTWGYMEDKWHLLDVYRARLDFTDLKSRAAYEATKWQADLVLVEESAAGFPLLDQLRREELRGRRIFMGCRPLDSKEVRFESHMGYLQTGRYLVPSMAPWLSDFRRELIAFPKAKNDDQVDSMVQFLQEYAHRTDSGFANPKAQGKRVETMRRIQAVRPAGRSDPWREVR